jgi:hypothetical protein
MSSSNNNNFEGFIKKVLGCVFISGISIFLYHLANKKLNIPSSKKDTFDQARDAFFSNHSELGGVSPAANDGADISKASDITSNEYLLFDSFIHSGEITAIVADAKVGKTLLACFMAGSGKLKKVVYFSLDDISSFQWERFVENSDIRYIKRHEFDKLLDDLRNLVIEKCGEQAYRDTIFKFASQINNCEQKLRREYGVDDQRKIEEIYLFELLMQTRLCAEADVVILDSLNSLVRYEWFINRPCIERIINFRRKIGKSMVILHHTNSKGQCAGSRALPQVVDLVLKMEKLNDNVRKIIVENDRYPQRINSCFVRMIQDENQFINFELCDEPIIQQPSNLSPFEQRIVDILRDKDVISFNDLYQLVGATNIGSLKNCLLNLEKKGYVMKRDGKSWEIIKNCTSGNAN